METETYTVDTTAPTLSASPAGGVFDAAQDVTLTSDDATATVRYTLDGSTPDAGSPVYVGGVIRVAHSLTLRTVATDPLGNSQRARGTSSIVPPPAADAQATPGFLLARSATGAVVAGDATTLSGVLAPQGQVVAGAKVVLQSRPVTTSGRPLAADWSTRTRGSRARDGAFAFTGLRTHAATGVPSGVQRRPERRDRERHPRVTVRGVVTLDKPARKVGRGHRMRFRRHARTRPAGATVVVGLEGPGRHGATVRATVSRTGAWTAVVRAPRTTGRWTAVATWHGNRVLLGDSSGSRTFRVTR